MFVTIPTVIDNPRSPRVRAVAKLAKRGARADTGLFLLEGPQAVDEALRYRPELLVDLYVSVSVQDRLADLIALAAAQGVEAQPVRDNVLEAMADTVTPQGVVATARHLSSDLDAVLAAGPRLVAVLEEIRDPGNAGTIIRAADAAGADAVLLTGRSVDMYNPKVVRSTTGSLFHLPIVQDLELEPTLDRLRAAGVTILAADIDGGELPELGERLAQPTAWLFGNEARGLLDEHVALADASVRVPIYGHAESMNLATAASVCLYQSAFAQRARA